MEANPNWFTVFMGIIGLAGLVIGVWATRVKNNSQAELETTKAKSQERISVAVTAAADAETARKEAEAQLAERTFIMDSHKRQIVINDQLAERLSREKELYEKQLADKEKQGENNYQVLSKTQDRIGQEIQGALKQGFQKIETKLDELPNKLQGDNHEFFKTVIGELATQMAERFAEMTMAQEWYPFPDVNDPEWHEDFIRPLVTRVRLYRRPVLSDASLTDVALLQGGETAKIIQGRKKGWLLVRLLRGTDALYGWLPEHEVITGLTAMKLATSENQTVSGADLPTSFNPATATP